MIIGIIINNIYIKKLSKIQWYQNAHIHTFKHTHAHTFTSRLININILKKVEKCRKIHRLHSRIIYVNYICVHTHTHTIVLNNKEIKETFADTRKKLKFSCSKEFKLQLITKKWSYNTKEKILS